VDIAIISDMLAVGRNPRLEVEIAVVFDMRCYGNAAFRRVGSSADFGPVQATKFGPPIFTSSSAVLSYTDLKQFSMFFNSLNLESSRVNCVLRAKMPHSTKNFGALVGHVPAEFGSGKGMVPLIV